MLRCIAKRKGLHTNTKTRQSSVTIPPAGLDVDRVTCVHILLGYIQRARFAFSTLFQSFRSALAWKNATVYPANLRLEDLPKAKFCCSLCLILGTNRFCKASLTKSNWQRIVPTTELMAKRKKLLDSQNTSQQSIKNTGKRTQVSI